MATGNGAGCFDVEEWDWADTTELTNVTVAGLGKCSYLVGERQVFIKDEAKIASTRPFMVWCVGLIVMVSD